MTNSMMQCFRVFLLIIGLTFSLKGLAHANEKSMGTITEHIQTFIKTLDEDQQQKTILSFHDSERFNFNWWPKIRKGLSRNHLNNQQTYLLKGILRELLSRQGAIKVDQIIATEAALGVIENDPKKRDPNQYYITLFGRPAPHTRWGVRFEGHHLSVNLTFVGNKMVSATPLFLGVNPETIPHGPHAGVRALVDEVDQAFFLFNSLSVAQQNQARRHHGWFEGFLTSPGDNIIKMGKPSGIAVSALNTEQSKYLVSLLRAYLDNITPIYATAYLEQVISEEWESLYFYWKGSKDKQNEEDYYYRIAGKRLFIEHIGFSGGSHVHAIWRDQQRDFGRQLSSVN